MASNFRLGSIKDVVTWDINTIEVKAIESKTKVEEEDVIEITVEDAAAAFAEHKPKGVTVSVDWKTMIDGVEIPFN